MASKSKKQKTLDSFVKGSSSEKTPTPREVPSQASSSVEPERRGRGLQLSELNGDLFSCPATASLAHCVSEDMHMGKGIAVAFKTRFKGVTQLKAQGIYNVHCMVG